MFFLLISASCFPQAGFLDETFGDSGKVYTDLQGQCNAATLQPDGKILAVGSGNISGFAQIIIRYLPDGKVDRVIRNKRRFDYFTRRFSFVGRESFWRSYFCRRQIIW